MLLKNIELKVTVEKLKKELVERQELLVKARYVAEFFSQVLKFMLH